MGLVGMDNGNQYIFHYFYGLNQKYLYYEN